MFGRHMEVKFVKNKQNANETTDEKPPVDYLAIADYAAKRIVIGIVAVMAAGFVLGTAEHLIVQATTKAPTQ